MDGRKGPNCRLLYNVPQLRSFYVGDDARRFQIIGWVQNDSRLFGDKKTQLDCVSHSSKTTLKYRFTNEATPLRQKRPKCREPNAKICIHDRKVIKLHEYDHIPILRNAYRHEEFD